MRWSTLPPHVQSLHANLITVGSCSSTHLLGTAVVKVPRIGDDPAITPAHFRSGTRKPAMRPPLTASTFRRDHRVFRQALSFGHSTSSNTYHGRCTARARDEAGHAELLMVGASTSTFRLGDMVIKIPRIDEDADITQSNAKAMKIKCNVYRILGQHSRVAECSYVSPMGDMVVLKHYINGNPKRRLSEQHFGLGRRLLSWAHQMIDGVAYLHSKGVRHSDLRLEQWLLDDDGRTIRLSDFNASGYDEQVALGLRAERAFGMEDAGHFLPRDADQDNTVRSDLFALGSALYELETGRAPYVGELDEVVEEKFAKGEFPEVGGMVLGRLIRGAWEGMFESAEEMLEVGKRERGLGSDGPPYAVD